MLTSSFIVLERITMKRNKRQTSPTITVSPSFTPSFIRDLKTPQASRTCWNLLSESTYLLKDPQLPMRLAMNRCYNFQHSAYPNQHIFSNTYQVPIKRKMEFPVFIFYHIILERFLYDGSYDSKRDFLFWHLSHKFWNPCKKPQKLNKYLSLIKWFFRQIPNKCWMMISSIFVKCDSKLHLNKQRKVTQVKNIY